MFEKKRLFWLLLLGLFVLGTLLRGYRLDAFPPGLNIDETAIGYNAYSILETGKDEYGVSYPLYFKSFNDHKLPVYIYSTALSIKVFGMTPYAIRFLSFFMGSITILSVFYLVYLLSKRKDIALIASFLLSINPWHFFFSRVAFEVNVAISLLTLGMVLFVFALERKRYVLVSLLVSTCCFVLAMYCYNVTRILSPLLYITLIGYYQKDLQKIRKTSVSLILFLWGICLLPFLITLFKTSGIATQQSVLIFGGETLANYIGLRSYMLDLPGIAAKVFFNTPIQIIWEYLKNIISFFSVDFFFIKGAHHPINGIGNFGMFHLLEFVTIPVGIFVILKKKLRYFYSLFLWSIVVVLLASLTNEIPHPTRTFGILIPFVIFSAVGISEIIKIIQKNHLVLVRRCMYMLVILFFGYSSVYYFANYFLKYPKEHADTYRSEDQKLFAYLSSVEDTYTTIVIDEDADVAYTSLLFYNQYPPETYHRSAVYTKHGQLQILKKLGKYEYRKINWEEDKDKKGTLFVTKKTTGFGQQPLKVFKYPEHPVVLYYDTKLGVFPTSEVAYEVYGQAL